MVGDGVVAVGDGVVAVGRPRADGVPVFLGVPLLVGTGGLEAAGIPVQALRTSANASVAYQQGPIRTESVTRAGQRRRGAVVPDG